MTEDIFLQYELQLAYDKIKACGGKREDGGYGKVVECTAFRGISEIWWAGLKFIKTKDRGVSKIIVKDTDYSFLPQGRAVSNEKYLIRLCDLIKKTTKEDIFENRANPKFVKKKIHFLSRFNNLEVEYNQLPNKLKERVRDSLKNGVSIIECAAKYNLQATKIRKIKNEL